MPRKRKAPEYWFDEAAADRACDFLAQLQHVKGDLAGQPFVLRDWQRDDIVRPLFGWKRMDGTRRYRTAFCELPRGNGKSSLGAGLALYLLFCDGESGAEVYSVAKDRDQALNVFDPAMEMVRRCPMLNRRARINETSKRISFDKAAGFYKAIAADAAGAHGFNVHACIFDELHVQPDRHLYDAMLTSFAKRKQPLMFVITTAGFDRSTICYELHRRALRAIEDPDSDPSFLPVIYAADPDDDWTDEATWEKANPNIDVSVSRTYLREQCAVAQREPDFENTFKRLHLNLWTQQNVRWLPVDKWDLCAGEVEPAELEGRECYAALDLATARDLCALVLLFPFPEGRYKLLARFWAPAEAATARQKSDRQGYEGWAAKGLIKLTASPTTDYQEILRDLEILREKYVIRKLGFDPWNAREVYEALLRAGWDEEVLLAFAQSFSTFNEPTKKLMELVLSKQIEHGGHPVLRWMAGNVTVKEDPSGNLRPDKGKSADKIDGIVALIMSIGLAITDRDDERESVYDLPDDQRVVFI